MRASLQKEKLPSSLSFSADCQRKAWLRFRVGCSASNNPMERTLTGAPGVWTLAGSLMSKITRHCANILRIATNIYISCKILYKSNQSWSELYRFSIFQNKGSPVYGLTASRKTCRQVANSPGFTGSQAFWTRRPGCFLPSPGRGRREEEEGGNAFHYLWGSQGESTLSACMFAAVQDSRGNLGG